MNLQSVKIEDYLFSDERDCIVRGSNFSENGTDMNFMTILKILNMYADNEKLLIRFTDNEERDRVLGTGFKAKGGKRLENLIVYTDSSENYKMTEDIFDSVFVYSAENLKEEAFINIVEMTNSKTVWFFQEEEENLIDIKEMLEIPDELIFEENEASTLEELKRNKRVKKIVVESLTFDDIESAILKECGFSDIHIEKNSMGDTLGEEPQILTFVGKEKLIKVLVRAVDDFCTNKSIFIKVI